MKQCIIFFLFVFSLKAAAQDDKLNKKISDDDRVLKIKISGKQDGRRIHYNKTFDVRDKSKAQRDSIVTHVLDSLQLNHKK